MARLINRVARIVYRVARIVSKVSQRGRWLDLALARAMLPVISTYKGAVSPYRRYRCAYALCTGNGSCSDVARHAFSTLTFSAGLAALEAQLLECGRAYRANPALMLAGAGTMQRSRFSGGRRGVVPEIGLDCCPPPPGP